jgi:hypothetical protein
MSTTVPGGRLIRVFNEHERAAIDPFKSAYMEANTPAARKSIAETDILPALFAYWRSIGEQVDSDARKNVTST